MLWHHKAQVLQGTLSSSSSPQPLCARTLGAAGTTKRHRDAHLGSPAGGEYHRTAGSAVIGWVSCVPKNGWRRGQMRQLVGKAERAVRHQTVRPSSLVPAPARGHTCCGESPGTCTIALIQWLMDQVGPLLGSLKGSG